MKTIYKFYVKFSSAGVPYIHSLFNKAKGGPKWLFVKEHRDLFCHLPTVRAAILKSKLRVKGHVDVSVGS